jgi:hypothetical protein
MMRGKPDSSFNIYPSIPLSSPSPLITLFMAGDVMTGRGIDQVLPYPSDPVIVC